MRIRIHFAVGSTAMAKTVELEEALPGFCDTVERNRRDDVILRFLGGESFAVAARSVVLVEEIE